MADNKILVVDDEEDILELVRYNLARDYSGNYKYLTMQHVI